MSAFLELISLSKFLCNGILQSFSSTLIPEFINCSDHLSSLEKAAIYKKDIPNEDEYLSTYGDVEVNDMLKEFINKSDDFNLNHKNIDEIVNNIWYVESLKNSWSSKDTASYACKKVCGKC